MINENAGTGMAPSDDTLGAIPVNYPAAFLECRVDRHAWSRPTEEWLVLSRDLAQRETECSGCGTVKVQVIDRRTWEIIGHPRYRYPVGYLMSETGIRPSAFRAVAFRQSFESWAERR